MKIKGILKSLFLQSKFYHYYERHYHQFDYEDVFLVSYPKSGNTWMRFMLTGLYLWRVNKGKSEVNYFNIHTYVKDIQLTKIEKTNLFYGIPRIIKSHRPYSPNYPRVIFLVRDVRDVMISYYKFLNRHEERFKTIDSVLKHPIYGVHAWVKHTENWLKSPTNRNKKLLFLRFEDLVEDPKNGLSKIFSFLNIQPSEDEINWIINQGSKERVREIEYTYGRARTAQIPFLRKGTSKQWVNDLTDSQKDYILSIAGPCLKECGYIE